MKPIFLIGYMGSGKSTLGRVLSEMLECEFTDLDAYIENRYHKTVKQILWSTGRRVSVSLSGGCFSRCASFKTS